MYLAHHELESVAIIIIVIDLNAQHCHCMLAHQSASQGFYSHWGQLARLTDLQSFITAPTIVLACAASSHLTGWLTQSSCCDLWDLCLSLDSLSNLVCACKA